MIEFEYNNMYIVKVDEDNFDINTSQHKSNKKNIFITFIKNHSPNETQDILRITKNELFERLKTYQMILNVKDIDEDNMETHEIVKFIEELDHPNLYVDIKFNIKYDNIYSRRHGINIPDTCKKIIFDSSELREVNNRDFRNNMNLRNVLILVYPLRYHRLTFKENTLLPYDCTIDYKIYPFIKKIAL